MFIKHYEWRTKRWVGVIFGLACCAGSMFSTSITQHSDFWLLCWTSSKHNIRTSSSVPTSCTSVNLIFFIVFSISSRVFCCNQIQKHSNQFTSKVMTMWSSEKPIFTSYLNSFFCIKHVYLQIWCIQISIFIQKNHV